MQTGSSDRSASRLRRKGWILCTTLLLSACATPGAPRPERSVERGGGGFTITEQVTVSEAVREDFRAAIGWLQQGQYERGIALLLEITEKEPEVTAAHIDLGIAYGRLNDLERAESSLKRALELNPHHPVACNELGILYRKTGRFEEARESYERALERHPDFHFARRNLAILCDVYLGDLSCALKNYELYAEAVPDDQAAAIWIADLRNRRAGGM